MTSVNITTTRNTVSVSTSGTTKTVEIATQGPQGPVGAFTLTDSAKVDKSIIYYDAGTSSFVADSTWTTDTLTDGGNF
jgi:hypothetical protein